jgi:hypothetical protein
MPALAAIRKKPQKREKQPPEKAPAKSPGQNKPIPRGKLPPVELMRELTRLVRVGGMSYAGAYRRVFPERKQLLSTASTQARLLVERFMRDHGRDLQEMLIANGLGEDRFAKELDKRYQAKTLHEIVTSEAKKVRLKDGRESYKVLTIRNTVEVEDNTTRMRATELHADVLGARKSAGAGGGIQQNVAVIYVIGGKIKKKRQERIVSP